VKKLRNFDALWRSNVATYQPKLSYLWKAHFIGYPLTYKSIYRVDQISELFRSKWTSAWKCWRKKLRNFDALWRSNVATYQPMLPYIWKAHFIGYPLTYKSIYQVDQITELFQIKWTSAWKCWRKKLRNFDALWRSNVATYQPMWPYLWKAHFIDYPLTHKSIYHADQITELFKIKWNSAWKCFGQLWCPLATNGLNYQPMWPYLLKAHFIGYKLTYKSIYCVDQISELFQIKWISAWKRWRKKLRNFDALWRSNVTTYQPILSYLWKAHFIGYPLTYKSIYHVDQIAL